MAPRGSLMHFTKRQATTASSRTGRFRLLKTHARDTHKRARTRARAHKTACCTRARPRPANEFSGRIFLPLALEQFLKTIGPLCVNGRTLGAPELRGASPCKVVSRDGRTRLGVSDVSRLGAWALAAVAPVACTFDNASGGGEF